MIPHKAFILAAGKGTRMRPLTDTYPKPMVVVAGRSLIDRTFDSLVREDVTDITVNLHHLGDVLKNHLTARRDVRIRFSEESQLLDTGGGIKKALADFGDQPFFVISGDSLWTDGPGEPALRRLAAAWDAEKMDILLLVQPVNTMVLTKGVGDYDIMPDGQAVRSLGQTGTYMFTSIRINSPRIFESTPDNAFSYLDLMDRAQAAGRLYALVHDGDWHHISTPQDLAAVNAAFEQNGP